MHGNYPTPSVTDCGTIQRDLVTQCNVAGAIFASTDPEKTRRKTPIMGVALWVVERPLSLICECVFERTLRILRFKIARMGLLVPINLARCITSRIFNGMVSNFGSIKGIPTGTNIAFDSENLI